MGRLVNCCAGVEMPILPSNRVNAILLNVPANASSKAAIKSAKQMLKLAGTTVVVLDSGGFQLHEADRLGKTIYFDPYKDLICDATRITDDRQVSMAEWVREAVASALAINQPQSNAID